MRVEIRRRVSVDESYRVARTHGLFNTVPSMAQEFNLDADVPIERDDWSIGVIYGPSGSGKTSIARALDEHAWTEWGTEAWPQDRAVIDVIDPDGDYEAVTGVLASVGLGTVPSWLRPYHVLSNGERFRAEMARLLAEGVTDVYLDEFTSVLDRQVACFGAQAFAKSWRRGGLARRVILITPHADVLGWVNPDWIVRTSLTGTSQTIDALGEFVPEAARPDSEVVGVVRA